MRFSVKLRIFVAILFAVTLKIFLYFADQGSIPEYVIYLLYAMFSIPLFLFVFLGYNE
jgi:hypothetical protein|uniref:Uncharacterized protein n=1 Tax=viral metagenome TaxID=1070528 RepID=A0A6C0M4D7_9ZZZZ